MPMLISMYFIYKHTQIYIYICVCVYLPIYLSIYPSIYLPIYLPTRPSVCLSNLSIYLSNLILSYLTLSYPILSYPIHRSIDPSIYLSIDLSIYLSVRARMNPHLKQQIEVLNYPKLTQKRCNSRLAFVF